MLRETPANGVSRWRMVNQRVSSGETPVALRFMTVGTGHYGRIIALGRDLRAAAAMRQRLLQPQQQIERDYLRLREAEPRYRLLFDASAEATLVIDAATSRFVEVNPAARKLVGNDAATAIGASFGALFEPGSRDRATAVIAGEQPCFGFTIRAVGRRLRDDTDPGTAPRRDLPRSVEQLAELVGRVSLKEIVRESTDLIERLCIEAALAYTDDNRASAAEILGLSRQSLYSKLHRHGLGNLAGGDE